MTKTFVRHTDELVDLYVDGEVISTTEEHPFWTPDKGWVDAGDLVVGSLLQTEDGRVIDVDKVEKREGQFEVYNFKVEGFHTYFVSDLGVLVHNANYDTWNITDHTVTVKHHNWNKIFGDQEISVGDVESIIKEALNKGEWQSVKTYRGKRGKIVGEGLILEADVNGHTIWVEGMKDTSGNILVKNAGVK